MNFPSDQKFCSYLQYSSRGISTLSKKSKEVVKAVKNDGVIKVSSNGVARDLKAIDHICQRLHESYQQYPFFVECFGPDVILVPAPKSAPLVKGGLWPTQRICDELESHGLCRNVIPLVKRVVAVQKSATAAPGTRPTPEQHYKSIEVSVDVNVSTSVRAITIVDDVITRGATFIACHAKLAEAYPGIPIFCFALIRTVSPGEIEAMRDPVQGVITKNGSYLHREP